MIIDSNIVNYIEPNSERWLSLEDLPNERWKDIKDFEGLYKISDYGRVKSLIFRNKNSCVKREKILKQSKDKDGYLQVRLCKNNTPKGFRVHNLVGKAFISNPENKPIYNHLKPVTKEYCNNHYTNLKPATYSENVKYAYDLGTKPKKNQYKGVYGKDNPFSKKVIQLDLNENIIRIWDCINDVERELGYNHSLISAACRNARRMKTYKGYKWKYYKKEGEK